MAPLKVLFIPTLNSGVTFYRMYQFVEAAMRMRKAHFHILWWQWGLQECHPWEVDVNDAMHYARIMGEMNDKVRMADVVVMGMVHTEAALAAFHAIRDAYPHIPVVTEIDDNFVSTPEYNPASEWYQPNSVLRQLVVAQLRASDAVVTTTPHLKEVYLEFNENIYDIPNCINLRLWDKAKRISKGGIRIGWAGGANHREDLRIIEPIISRVRQDFKDARWVFVHGMPDFIHTRKDVICTRKFTTIDKYPSFLAGHDFDIGIAPLVDNSFNRGKSNLRWLEYSSLRVPTVASNVGHFKQTLNDGVDAILADDSEGFYQGIKYLIENRSARKKIGAAAYHRIATDFSVETVTDRYIKVLEEIKARGQVGAKDAFGLEVLH